MLQLRIHGVIGRVKVHPQCNHAYAEGALSSFDSFILDFKSSTTRSLGTAARHTDAGGENVPDAAAAS